MKPSCKTERLRTALRPHRVAFVGGRVLEPAIAYCRRCGFAGPIDVVNPQRAEIAGIACVPRVADMNEAPDLAFVAVPKEGVVDIVGDLARRGSGAAIVNASGFSESHGGAARQAALVAAAGKMPVIGPNGPGLANFLDRAVFMMDHFGDHAPEAGIAVISNGGAYLSDLGCADRSQPIAYLIGLGNQAMVTMADMILAVLQDDRVRAVNLYFEGLRDVARLSEAAAIAARKAVPVVAIKGGRSAAGGRAAQSHTASLAGDAAIASALFARFGWIEVETPSEAIETLKMLTLTARPRGPRTGFVTSSGSYAVLGADAAGRAGLDLPPPSDRVADKLAPLLPNFVGPANPLDISTAQGAEGAEEQAIYQAFLEDDFDLALQVMCYPPAGGWAMDLWDAATEAFATAAAGRPAAFINTLPESIPEPVRRRLIERGIAPLQGLEDGLRAAGHVARYGALFQDLTTQATEMALPPPPAAATKTRTLNEAEAKAWLANGGLPVPKSVVTTGADDLEELTYPVAVKAMVPGLIHKSEAGAVILNLPDPAAAAAAIHGLRRKGLKAETFLVEEMVQNGIAELLVGLRQVPHVGWALTLGIGGSAVELLDDTRSVILPAPRAALDAALRGLRLFPLLDGYRGRPSVDLAETLAVLDQLISRCLAHPEIVELEINPLLLTADGAVIVDAVLLLAEGGPVP